MDVVLLALFCSASQQYDHLFSIFPKVNAVSRAEMNFAFKNAGSDTFDVGEISQADAVKSHCYFSPGLHIQPAAPFAERTPPSGVQIFADLDHPFHSSIYFTTTPG